MLISISMQDSPVGIRFADYATVFSSGQTVAATFDRGLFYARGHAMGQEHKAKGVTVQLGPVAGPLGRSPEGGRNWEGFSPDPYLSMCSSSQGSRNKPLTVCSWYCDCRDYQRYTGCRYYCLRKTLHWE